MSQATDHFARGDWQAAYDAWSRTEPDALSADELGSYGATVELVGTHDEVVRVLQRAFLAHREAGDLHAASGCAFRLSMAMAEHGEHALAGGWAARAAELVEEIGEECVERGWAGFLMMYRALGEGDDLGDETRVGPGGSELAGEDGLVRARAGGAPGAVADGAVDGVGRGVERHLPHFGAVQEPSVPDPAAPGHHREAPEPLTLAEQFDAADPQSSDPAAVARLHGHLRVTRGQRDVFVTHGSTLLR